MENGFEFEIHGCLRLVVVSSLAIRFQRPVSRYGYLKAILVVGEPLDGVVVKASTSGAEGPVLNSWSGLMSDLIIIISVFLERLSM